MLSHARDRAVGHYRRSMGQDSRDDEVDLLIDAWAQRLPGVDLTQLKTQLQL